MFLVILAIISYACMERRVWGRQAPWSWGEPAPSEEERFEGWHRDVHSPRRGAGGGRLPERVTQ